MINNHNISPALEKILTDVCKKSGESKDELKETLCLSPEEQKFLTHQLYENSKMCMRELLKNEFPDIRACIDKAAAVLDSIKDIPLYPDSGD